MTAKERVFHTLAGTETDRVPNLNIIMMFAARYANVPYSEFVLCPEKMVAANLLCCRKFGFDIVTVMSDPFCEAEGFGCEISYPHDDHPNCTRHILEDYEDLAKLAVRDPHKERRMSLRLKTIELYRKECGEEYPITGWVEGPIAEFSDLRDINEAMTDLILEPEFAGSVMDLCVEQAQAFARAQIEAGADIIGVGDAAASLVGPDRYRQFVLPREKRIIDAIHSAGAKVKLHICGDISPLLSDIATLGADIVDVDFMVDYARAQDILSGVSSVNGNLDPVRLLQNASPEEVAQRVRELRAIRRPNSIISGGCEITPSTPHENLLAMSEALR